MNLKVTLLLVASALVLSAPMSATMITYSTSGTLTCTGCVGNGTNTVTGGVLPNTATITYAGLSNATVCALSGNVPCTTNTSFGDFFSSATGAGGTLSNGTFALTVTQTAPPPTGGNPATFNATFSGTITTTTNGVQVSFDGSNQSRTITAVLGNTTYTLPSFFLLVPLTTNGGDTTVQGVITYTPNTPTQVPEPTTTVMLSLGLLGLGALTRKFRA